MRILDEIIRRFPAIIIFSVIAATLYNAGFLAASSTYYMITNLTYQDILISSIFIVPVISVAYIVMSGVFTNITSVVYLEKWWKYCIAIIIIIISLMILYFSNFALQSFGWIFLIFGMSPFVGLLLKIFNLPLEREALAVFAILLAGAGMAYGEGYSSFKYRSCYNGLQISISDCERCVFVKAFSEFIIVRDPSTDKILFFPNDHRFSMKRKSLDPSALKEDPFCNPVGTAVSKFLKSHEL